MKGKGTAVTDYSEISYDDCRGIWENPNTLVHSDMSDEMFSDIEEYISKVLKLKRDDTVLTIGCGDGRIDLLLKKRVAKMWGIDFSMQKIEEAKNRNTDVEYIHQSFLDTIPEYVRPSVVYSYSVMQYCKPEDVYEFFKKQFSLYNDGRLRLVAHLDVPDKKKAEYYYKRKKQIIPEKKDLRILFNDGSYWHDLEGIMNSIKKQYHVVMDGIISPAKYWDYRSDIILNLKR